MMLLTRTQRGSDGIFGELKDPSFMRRIFTLEHAYLKMESYVPIVPEGTYSCVRGMHRLENAIHPLETFEITQVPGHFDILFHMGNFNKDSQGCVLLGLEINQDITPRSITFSAFTFNLFMQTLKGINQFELTVENHYDL